MRSCSSPTPRSFATACCTPSKSRRPRPKWLIIAADAITDIDITAAESLQMLHDELAQRCPSTAPRRNLFCVGRNYHAHAKELRESVFKDNPKPTTGLAHRVQQGA
jgi:2-keto-4-pentenoate hydratase/2-oxohepta-3-ene-1,7-dioic acid hydratase in catechol pathway